MKKLTLFWLLIPVFQAFSQTRLSLETCIQTALSKNISLQQATLGLENNRIQVNQSKTNRLPTVNGSAGHNYNFGRSIDPFTNQYITQSIQSNNFSVSSSMVLYNGFQLQNTIKQNENNLKVAEKNLEVLQNNISLNVANQYLQILLSNEQLKNARLQKSLTESQLKRAGELYEAGNQSRSSVVNLEAQVANDQVAIVNAESAVRNGYAQLAALLQESDYNNIRIQPIEVTEPAALGASLNTIIEKSFEAMPEIDRDKLQMQSSLIGLEIAKGAYMPRLSLFANLNTVYTQSRKERYDVQQSFITIGQVEGTGQNVLSPYSTYKLRTTAFGRQLADNFGQSLGLSLSVPIYNNGRIKNNVELNKISYRNNALVLENTKQTLRNNIITAYANYENAKATYLAAVQNEKSQKTNFDFASDRFDAGLVNSVELLNAKNTWVTATNNTLQARYEYVFRKLILDFYQGLPLRIQ